MNTPYPPAIKRQPGINNQRYGEIDIPITTQITTPITYGMDTPIDILVKPSYPKFINKVLLYVLLQLVFTSITSIIGYIYRDQLINLIKDKPKLIYIPLGAFILSIILITCSSRQSKFCLYKIFTIFTLSSASVVTISILPYSPYIVLQAVTGTTLTVSFVNIYAFWCSKNVIDFAPWSGAIISASLAMIPLIIIQMLLPITSTFSILISILFMFLFIVYLMYDLNQLYNGNSEKIFQHPIYAAISIYLDIINIFLYMLELFGVCNNNSN